MNWNIHINDITSKGNNTLSFLRRNLKINSVPLKECAYKTLVRPLVEYSSTVWDPYTQNNIWNLEMVQRRSARYVLNQYHTTASVTTMINQLNWESLQRRRENARLNMFYKAHHGLAAIQLENYLVPMQSTRSLRNSSENQYQIPHSSADYHLYSFFPRTVRVWNSLPSDITSAPTLPTFKSRLHQHQN